MRDRDLVRLYWPVELRPAFDALFAIDDAMVQVVVRATDPTLAAIKLAWWRDRLEGLDRGEVPAEPRLQAAAQDLLPLGIGGVDLAGLERGYATLLEQAADPEVAIQRGALLFGLAGRLFGVERPFPLDAAGRLFAAGQLHRLGLAPRNFTVVTDMRRIPASLRRLTGMAALARRDLYRKEPEATPARAFALLRHRLTGRIG